MTFLFSTTNTDSSKNNIVFGSSDTTKIIKMSQDISSDWLKREAEEKLKEKIIQAEKEDLEHTEYSKNQNPRKYSWDIGYYQRQKKDALKTIERCDRKITYFKAKSK